MAVLAQSELLALQGLHDAFEGRSWDWSGHAAAANGSAWDFGGSFDANDNRTYPRPCGVWFGVDCACGSGVCHVVALDLHGVGLTGEAELLLTTVFASLVHVVALNANDNRLRGPLPPLAPANFSGVALTELRMGGNRLSGGLSAAWLCSGRLAVVDLRANRLSGRLDDAARLCNDSQLATSALQRLDLSDNRLTGSLPLVFDASLPHRHWRGGLQQLSLARNCLAAAAVFGRLLPPLCAAGQLPALTTLQLEALYDDDACSGDFDWRRDAGRADVWWSRAARRVFAPGRLAAPFPSCALTSFTRLQTLSLPRNGLFGPLDDGSLGVALVASLTALDASDNALSGALPAALQRHAAWTRLDLQRNRLAGRLDAAFAREATNLTRPRRAHNDFAGPLPQALATPPPAASLAVLGGKLFACMPRLAIGWSSGDCRRVHLLLAVALRNTGSSSKWRAETKWGRSCAAPSSNCHNLVP